MAKSKKEKRERRVTSARRRVDEHQSGVSLTSVNLPDGIGFFSVKEAKTYRFDIIPYLVKKGSDEPGGNPHADEGETAFERTFWTHRIGVDNQSYVCLLKTFRKPCPVCEARAKLMKDPDHDEELVKSLAPKERQVFNVIDVSSEEGREKGIQLFENSFHTFGKALDNKIKSGDDGEYDLFADLAEGLTVKATFEKKSGGGYSFMDCVAIEFKPRKAAYDDEMLDEAVDLDSVPREMDYKELKKIYEGGGADEDDEDDDKPAKKGSKPKPKAKDDEDEDDEDTEEEDTEGEIVVGSIVSFTYKKKQYTGEVTDIITKKGKEPLAYVECDDRPEPHAVNLDELTLAEEEEEEEEKPAPKKKPGRPKKKVEVEEDEEDEDTDDGDDEDDDDPPPAKKGKKPVPAKKGKAKDEDEDEDEDESDDDDDDWDDD